MEENYSQELYDWIVSQDDTFEEREPFEQWQNKVSEDANYQDDLYKWISSVDNTFEEREPFAQWSQKVKKKDESVSISPEEGMDGGTQVVEEPGSLEPSVQGSDYEYKRGVDAQGLEIGFSDEYINKLENPNQEAELRREALSDYKPGVDAQGIEMGFSESSLDNLIFEDAIKKEQENITQEDDTLLEDFFGKNIITDFFGDMYRAGAQGQAQGGSLDESLELFIKGKDVTDEDIQDFIIAQERMNNAGQSDEMRDFSKIYEEDGGGWWGFIKGVASNPTVIPQLFVSSVSAMVNPTTLAAAGVGAGTGAAIGSTGFSAGPLGVFTTAGGAMVGAMAASGAVLEAGLSFAELLLEQLDGKPMTKENVREILESEEKMQGIRFKSAGRGIAIGVIDGITGGVASKVTAKVAGATGKKLLASTAGGTVEAFGGGVGEVAGRLVAGQEMDVAEIGFESVAGTATTPLTVGYGLYKSPKYYINPDNVGGENKLSQVSGREMAKFLRESTDEEIAGAQLSFKNDPVLEEIANERIVKIKQGAVINSDLKQAGIDGEENLKTLTALELEKQNLSGNTTEAGKNRLSQIDKEIKELTTAAQAESAEARVKSKILSDNIYNLIISDNVLKSDEAEALIKESYPNVEKIRVGRDNLIITYKKSPQRESYTEEVYLSGRPADITKRAKDAINKSTLEQQASAAAPVAQAETVAATKKEAGADVITEEVDANLRKDKAPVYRKGGKKLLFTGSPRKFTTFDMSKVGSNADGGSPKGIFFSNDPGVAGFYANEVNGDGMGQLLNMVGLGKLKGIEPTIYSAVLNTENIKEVEFNGESSSSTMDKNAIIQEAFAEGFDAVTLKNIKDGPSVPQDVTVVKDIKFVDQFTDTQDGKGKKISNDLSKQKQDAIQEAETEKAPVTQAEKDLVEDIKFQEEVLDKQDLTQEDRTAREENLTKLKEELSAVQEAAPSQTKTEQDAIQEPSTKEVDVQEPTTDSREVGEGDTEVEPTTKSETKEKSESESDTTQTAEEEVMTPQEEAEAAADLRELIGETEAELDTEVDTEAEVEVEAEVDTPPAVETQEEVIIADNKGNVTIKEGVTNSKVKLKGEQINENLIVTNRETGKDDNYYSSRMFAEENPDTSVQDHENKIVVLAKKASKAISKILPNTKIVVHRSEAAYNKFVAEEGSRGVFDPSTNIIHVNMPNATAKTIAHEVFHAVLYNKFGTDAKIEDVTKRMVAAVKRKVTDKKLKQELKDFSENYTEFQNEEYLSELVGVLADNYPSLSAKEKNIVRVWLEKIAEIIGIPTEIDTDGDVLDLLNTIGKSVKEGKEITATEVKQLDLFEGGEFVDNPSTALKEQKVGGFDVTYTQQESVADMIKKGLITEPKDISFMEGQEVSITAPDDMLAGEIKYNGKVIFEGEGGVFFVTKFGDVWASGKVGPSNTIVKNLNQQLKNNDGKAYLVLTKGTDAKLVSSPSGVNSTLAILNTILDNNLISASMFRSAVSTAVKKAKGQINLRQSAKDLKTDIQKYFTDTTTSTFKDRGFIIKDIVNYLAKNLAPESQAAVAAFLGGDAKKNVGVGNTPVGVKSPGSQSLVDLIAKIAAEKLTKGLNVGDVYAAIEINSEVEVRKDSHPSYPFHISLKDGSKPILHLFKNREPGAKVFESTFGKDNSNPYKVGQVSVMRGKVKKADSKVTDKKKTTTQRQQRTIQQVAKMYNMTENGYFPKNVDTFSLKKAVANAEGNYSIRKAKSGSFFLSGSRGIVKDLFKRPQSRQRQQIVFNKSETPASMIKKARELKYNNPEIKEILKENTDLSAPEINELLKVPVNLFKNLPESFINVKGGVKKGLATFRDINNFIKTLNERNEKLETPLTQEQLSTKAIEKLQSTEAYKNAADFTKVKGEMKASSTPSTQQIQMEVAVRESFDVKPTKDAAKTLRNLKSKIKERLKGIKDIQKIKRELRNFIRQSLPNDQYTKANVLKMVRFVANLTVTELTGPQLKTTMDKIQNFVTEKNIATLKSKLETLLDTKNYTKLENSILKGKKVSADVKTRIDKIRESIPLPSTTSIEIQSQMAAWTEEINTISGEMVQTNADLSRMSDLEIMIKLSNSVLMDGADLPSIHQVSVLDSASTAIESLIKEGKSSLREELAANRAKAKKEMQDLYNDMTGENVNLTPEKFSVDDAKEALSNDGITDPTDIEIADKIIELQDENAKEIQSIVDKIQKDFNSEDNRLDKKKNNFILTKAFRAVTTGIDNFLNKNETLQGLMDIISKGPGEMLGGVAQRLFYKKINSSSISYKARMILLQDQITNKMAEIYGKSWKKDARSDSRPVGTGVYRDAKAVAEAQKKVDENPTRKNRKNLEQVIEEQEIIMSPNEIYYQYNQFQDPANKKSYANKKNRQFGNDPDRITQELYDTLSDENKEWARWQREEFFPEVYEHYNEVYKKIYRTDMPWNEFYAGRIYRTGKDGKGFENVDVLNLRVSETQFVTSVGSSSTKSRVDSDTPIAYMDGNDALMSYITDMEWFAAYAENVRDISKLMNNTDIKKTIEIKHGSDMNELIDTQINRIATRGINTSDGNKVVNLFNNIFITSRLGLNPTVMLKQLTSMPTYANSIGPINYAKYAVKNKAEMLKVYKEIRDNSVYMKDRGIQDMKKVIESYSTKQTTSFLPQGLKSKFGYFSEFMMVTTKLGDRAAIFLGGMPNYSYYKAEFKKKKPNATEQQAIDYAIRKFELDTKSTQQSMDLQDKDYFQAGGPIARAFNMFMTTPKQYFRMERMAFRQLWRKTKAFDRKAGKGTLGQNLRTLAMYHVVMPALFQYVTLGLPGMLRKGTDEDEKDMMRAAILGNLNSLYLVGDLLTMGFDKFRGKPWAETAPSLPVFEMTAELMRLGERAQTTIDPEKKAEYTTKFITKFMDVSSLPASNMYKLYKNYEKLVDGKVDNPGEAFLRAFNYSDYVIEGQVVQPTQADMDKLKEENPQLWEKVHPTWLLNNPKKSKGNNQSSKTRKTKKTKKSKK